MIVVLRRM